MTIWGWVLYSMRKVKLRKWSQIVDTQYSMRLSSPAVIVSVSRRWHRSEICKEGHSCWGYGCLTGPTAFLTSQDSVGLERLVRDPGASGAERERSHKGITDGWRTRAESEGWSLFRSLALPSSNLLVLCHVIKLLKGQTFHTLYHTKPFHWPFLTQSLG